MSPSPYTEDTLVQQTTAEYLEERLGWESVYAHNTEDFGPNSLLGRASDREVAEYNREKDRVTIERTFEALLKLVQELNEEESRAVREGLDEESLVVFDHFSASASATSVRSTSSSVL